ncbi:MAG: hypothetical protein EU548_01085 [Promethearchaeota archaeon]|nr:MAG: hypothetical protein EU548_01085 [Candidatus Lokiarchaeota archaeon]
MFGFNNFHRRRENENNCSDEIPSYFFPRHPHGPRPPEGERPHPPSPWTASFHAGRKYLDELRNRWANHFAIMSEMAPPEHFGEKFLHKGFKRLLLGRFEELESKQEMLDYLKRLSAWINSMLHRLDERKNHLEIKHQKLAELTEKLNTIDKWDKQEFKSLIKKYFSK